MGYTMFSNLCTLAPCLKHKDTPHQSSHLPTTQFGISEDNLHLGGRAQHALPWLVCVYGYTECAPTPSTLKPIVETYDYHIL